MKRILNIITITVVAFFICITNSFAYDYDIVNDTSKKIYDYGDLLTESDEIYLKGLIDEYISTYNYDMVIVTKRNYSANTTNMMNYADDFYDYNNFGIGNTKDGILLFLNVDSLGPVVWISTTGNAILMYDDARINSLKSSMSSVKYNGNRAIVESFINNASSFAAKGIPSSNRDYYIDENGDYKHKKIYPIWIPIVSLVAAIITILVMLSKNKMIRTATQAREYLDKSSINITNKKDMFINTHTSRVNISSSSSGGGGSSTHSGSSGSSHGGGGGRI